MKFKWHWGTAITIFFIFFVGFLMWFFFYTLSINEGLITDHYYEEDLKYQQQIDRIERSVHPVKFEYDGANQQLHMTFPKLDSAGLYSGEIKFYRPSDVNKDFTIPVSLDTTFSIYANTEKMISGFWKIKILWKISDTEYYDEWQFTK